MACSERWQVSQSATKARSSGDGHASVAVGITPPAPMTIGPIPLSLYVHLPWCIKKCPYCDFNSHAQVGDLPEKAYIDALIGDLEDALPLIWGRSFISVFLGGGTPNLFSPESIGLLLDAIRARIRLLPGAEVTIEANPGAAQQGQFEALRAAGVTRLSLGVQSFDSNLLKAIGRVHDGTQALDAARAAVEVFERVNLDLMYGLPGQDLGQAQLDLETALAIGPGHVSRYQLTLEPNTLFSSVPPVLPEEDDIWEMQSCGDTLLAASDYERYEVSAYARAGQVSQHNTNYWTFGDYLGIGAGSHSKLTLPERGVIRQTVLRRPEDFMQAVSARAHRRTESIAAAALPFEFMLNALRLVNGVPCALYVQRTGQPLESIIEAVGQAQVRGLMSRAAGQLRATPKGLDFLNDLQQMFL